MSFKDLFNSYSNIGTNSNQKAWEISLIRKLNLLALFGTLNVFAGLVVFYSLNYSYFYLDCILVILCAPLVVVFNKTGKYVWATYLFSFIGFAMFGSLNLKMGQNSLAFVLYFPLVMSIVQLFGRKEMMIHMISILALGFFSVCLVLYGFRHQWLQVNFSEAILENIKTINLFFGLLTTLIFVVTISYEGTRQEKLINNMLHEKEVLLAEVFHRVKNNMNIVTSLLNLKKNASSSPEVQDALEECRNRVFSMALVHQKIYSSKNFTRLNFKEYTNDLVNALRESVGSAKATIQLDCEIIELELSHAIPCGLILNELITNSFKHALMPSQTLNVFIQINQIGKEVLVTYEDNGPGLTVEAQNNKNTLGLDLIRSLSDQLSASYEFTNANGLLFELRFLSK